MKIKCPYCNQSYDLTDKDIIDYGEEELECTCGKRFLLRDTVTALEEYRSVIELQEELKKETEEYNAEKENLKIAKEMARQNGADEYEVEDDIDDRKTDLKMMKDEIDYLRDKLAEAKDEYRGAKGCGRTKIDAEDFLYKSVYKMLEKGMLKGALSPDDKTKILHCIMAGNCNDVFSEILERETMNYCFVNEFAEIIGRLQHDKYLPLIGIPDGSDGSITPKQLALLVRFGFDEMRMAQLSKSDASTLISRVLNQDGFAKDEWAEAFQKCENVGELRDAIARFNSAQLVIPPPKEASK